MHGLQFLNFSDSTFLVNLGPALCVGNFYPVIQEQFCLQWRTEDVCNNLNPKNRNIALDLLR